MGDVYIQHNPYIKDGYDALVDAMENNPRWAGRPKMKLEMRYPVAEGDIVYFQVILAGKQGTKATVWEKFRFDSNGKIVEHWDVFQQVDMANAINDAALY